VTIRLFSQGSNGTWTEVAGKSPIQSNADGSYSFSGLAAGTYQVQETPPPQYVDGKDTVGSLGGTMTQTAGQGDQFQVPIGSGQAGTAYNFGIQGLQPDMVSARLFLASTPTGAQLLDTLHTAPSVSLSGTSGSAPSGVSEKGGTPVAFAAAATISSPDSPTLVSMTVTISDLQDGASETLAATTTGTPITASYANGVLSLSGVADLAAYQTVLEGITYSDSALSPTAGTRTIDVVVNDGTDSSPAVTTTVTIGQVGTTATSTAVTAAPSPAVFGQSVTLAATVAGTTGSGTPTGTVTFSEGGTTLGTAALDSTGAASFSTTTLVVGTDTVTASYSGDTTYAVSSGTVIETINQ
jgi:hypothetical protein